MAARNASLKPAPSRNPWPLPTLPRDNFDECCTWLANEAPRFVQSAVNSTYFGATARPLHETLCVRPLREFTSKKRKVGWVDDGSHPKCFEEEFWPNDVRHPNDIYHNGFVLYVRIWKATFERKVTSEKLIREAMMKHCLLHCGASVVFYRLKHDPSGRTHRIQCSKYNVLFIRGDVVIEVFLTCNPHLDAIHLSSHYRFVCTFDRFQMRVVPIHTTWGSLIMDPFSAWESCEIATIGKKELNNLQLHIPKELIEIVGEFLY